MPTPLRLPCLLLVPCFYCAGLHADDESFGGGKPPHAEALFTETAPAIDGVWAEGEWAAAKPIFFPAPAGSPEGSKGEVRILWNAEGVYVTFRATDTNPVFGDFKPGEPLHLEDVFEIFFDQVGDHRQFCEIQFDPAGQLYLRNNVLTAPPRLTPQKRLTQEFAESELWRYDLPKPDGMQVASKLDAQTHQWTLEAFLPASLVNRRRGGKAMEPCTWRVNLVRHDWDAPKDVPKRHSQFIYWAPVLNGMPHISPEAMGWLELKKP